MITQRKALARMEEETRIAMRRLEDAYSKELLGMWQTTVENIRANILNSYRQDFGRDTWDLVGAHARGTLERIGQSNAALLVNFEQKAAAFVRASLDNIHRQERLRALWMIDQATPGSYMPKHPFRQAREAAAGNPRDAKASWEQALSAWVDTYHTTLNSNLKMESLHEGDLHDAADEADSTRIDGYDPAYKFSTMFSSQAIREEADARRAIFDDNEDMVEEEIWVTMEDGVVCSICEEYDGKPLDEVPDDIPAHYNCRCYTRFVPKAWAEMLRSGDDEERELALKMDDAGIVPGGMAIRSQRTGEIIGRAIVTFEDWKQDRAQNITGMAGAI